MPRTSAIARARSTLVAFFDSHPQRVYASGELAAILELNRAQWNLNKSLSVGNLIRFLESEGLREIRLRSSYGTTLTRYAWSTASDPAIALSAFKTAYLSHLSAVVLHDLTDQVPSTIYINREQSEKNRRSSGLTQDGIDRAFARKPRHSNLTYQFDGRRILVLSGKFTGQLEVADYETSSGERLRTTNLERTLIDITVRPQYAGGIAQVMEAFSRARTRCSTNVLMATLKRLDYAYPYHQAIGFYMQRTGYSEHQLALFRQLPINLDFYLSHGIARRAYDPVWRLYYPEGL